MAGRRQTKDDYESSDDEPIQIQCWIPGEGIDTDVLGAYLKEFVDSTPTVRAARNPQDPHKSGFMISANNTLSVAGLKDVIRDSKVWTAEQRSESYRKEGPYYYMESDTWEKRKKNGATPGFKNPRPQRRRTTGGQRNTAAADPPRPPAATAGGGGGGGRHADAPPPPPYSAPRNDPSPTRGPRPGGTNPNTYNMTALQREVKDAANRLGDPQSQGQANQGAKVQGTGRHASKDDDNKPSSGRLPQPKPSRHDDREKSYSYH